MARIAPAIVQELTDRNAYLEQEMQEKKPHSPDSRAGSKEGSNFFAIQLSVLPHIRGSKRWCLMSLDARGPLEISTVPRRGQTSKA